ncbi:hypothetical protein PENTCL1PPCAC_14468, partial [Pristionchus entomophagus]
IIFRQLSEGRSTEIDYSSLHSFSLEMHLLPNSGLSQARIGGLSWQTSSLVFARSSAAIAQMKHFTMTWQKLSPTSRCTLTPIQASTSTMTAQTLTGSVMKQRGCWRHVTGISDRNRKCQESAEEGCTGGE